MMTQVKIKVRPKQTVKFPDVCVHCNQPASEMMLVRKRISRITRLIGVPVCLDCARQLARKSGEEERLQKLDWLVSGAVFLLVLAITLSLIPAGLAFWLRLLSAGLVGLAATAVSHTLFQRKIRSAYLQEKQAILASARIVNFSWRATTFTFENETFRERFIEINEPLLMEI